MALLRAIATFLAISGIVAIVIGLMYLSVGNKLPHLLQGHVHTSHHFRRGEICLAAGAACVAVAWLLRGRRKGLTAHRGRRVGSHGCRARLLA